MQYLDLHAVSLIIKKRIPEEEEHLLTSRDEDFYIIKTYIRRRGKKINKLGKISYSEWKEIFCSKKKIKEELKSHVDIRENYLLKNMKKINF